MRIPIVLLLCFSACGGGGEGTAADAAPTGDVISLPAVELSSTPEDGSSEVPVASIIMVRFPGAMVPADVTIGVAPDLALAATEWNESRNEVTLLPAGPLARGTKYTVTVGGAASLVFSFTTVAAAAATTPEIVDFFPGAQAACDAQVSMSFTAPMDPRTVAVTVTPGDSLGKPTWSEGLRRVTFAEAPAFLPATFVDLVVTGADLAGNPLAADQHFRFMTCPLPLVAPLVAATYPAPGAVGVTPGTRFRITFTEPMDISATRFAVETSPSLTCLRYVAPKFIAHFDDSARTFTCDAGAAASTLYTVTVRAANDTAGINRATSQEGVLMEATYTFTFQTGAAISDGTTPRITDMEPLDATRDVAVNTTLVIVFDEEMDPTGGTLGIATPSFVDRSWNTPPTQVTYRFASPFAYGADISYTLTGFRDRASNVMPTVTAGFSTRGRATSTTSSTAARDGTVERPGTAQAGGGQIFVGISGRRRRSGTAAASSAST
jgi:hypothetical protein